MSSTEKILRYYGLRRPYDFSVAVPLLMNTLLLATVLCAASCFIFEGKLSFGTPRFCFFVYLAVVLGAGIALSRFYVISILLFMLCCVDFGLGAGSLLFYKTGLSTNLMPSDHDDPRPFVYHPLLQVVPRPNYRSGRGVVVRHNSLGIRGEEIKQNPGSRTILVYGGSTTYDLAVDQGKTWVELLQSHLGSRYTVLNCGVPGYSTAEHVLQAAFYQRFPDTFPAFAVYYIGWNDIRNAHVPHLDPGYADFHLLGQLDDLQVRSARLGFTSFSPLLRMLLVYIESMVDVVPEPPTFSGLPPQAGSDPNLERIYADNIATLVAINRSRGIKTIFIGQILNREKLKSDRVYGWLPLVKDKDVWPLMAHFNGILEKKARELGAEYIDLDVDRFNDHDFVDNGHFSAPGSRKFADLVYRRIAEVCR